jgi:hypothetical protein
MADFQTEVNRTVEGFIAQITQLARRAAVDTSNRRSVIARTALPLRTGKLGSARLALQSPGRPRGHRGAKRTAADLEALSTKFTEFVKANPGLRIEQINKELGTTTKDLALPIRKLIAEGMISAKGQKRSTQYFPGRKAK